MKKLFQLFIGLFLLIAIPITIFLAGQRQEIRKKAAPATTMTITPVSVIKKVGDVFTIEIIIDTGENQIVAVELHMTFNSDKLEAQSVTNGALFPNILSSGTVEPGAATITVGAADAKQPVRGMGTVATMKFLAKEKTDAPAAIKFSSNTFVGGLGEGASNVLVGTTPAAVTITQDIALATPTPTPPAKQDPAPQGTATPTVTPISPDALSSPSGQPTIPPTPTPTGVAMTEFAIASPAKNDTATTDKPIIQGKALPGSTITVTVYSTPQTVTVVADESGNWSYTPEIPLESGPHNIVASTTDQNGQTVTATTAFIVAAGSGIGGSENVIPVSGTVETTILLLLLGSILITAGYVVKLSMY